MILICLLGLFCACGDDAPMKTEVKKNADGSTYEVKNGVEERTFSVNSGEQLVITVSVTVTSGELDLSIFKTDDRSVNPYESNDMQTASFTVTVKEAGEYTIRINANDFVGTYSFEY